MYWTSRCGVTSSSPSTWKSAWKPFTNVIRWPLQGLAILHYATQLSTTERIRIERNTDSTHCPNGNGSVRRDSPLDKGSSQCPEGYFVRFRAAHGNHQNVWAAAGVAKRQSGQQPTPQPGHAAGHSPGHVQCSMRTQQLPSAQCPMPNEPMPSVIFQINKNVNFKFPSPLPTPILIPSILPRPSSRVAWMKITVIRRTCLIIFKSHAKRMARPDHARTQPRDYFGSPVTSQLPAILTDSILTPVRRRNCPLKVLFPWRPA